MCRSNHFFQSIYLFCHQTKIKHNFSNIFKFLAASTSLPPQLSSLSDYYTALWLKSVLYLGWRASDTTGRVKGWAKDIRRNFSVKHISSRSREKKNHRNSASLTLSWIKAIFSRFLSMCEVVFSWIFRSYAQYSSSCLCLPFYSVGIFVCLAFYIQATKDEIHFNPFRSELSISFSKTLIQNYSEKKRWKGGREERRWGESGDGRR